MVSRNILLFCLLVIIFEANAVLSKLWGSRVKKQTKFTNNYGYGPLGWGPQGANAGIDSFGFIRDKYYNSGLPPKYTWSSFSNYYSSYGSFHQDHLKYKTFLEEFIAYKNRHEPALPHKFPIIKFSAEGPYYNGVWGYNNHSPYWFG